MVRSEGTGIWSNYFEPYLSTEPLFSHGVAEFPKSFAMVADYKLRLGLVTVVTIQSFCMFKSKLTRRC